MSYRGKMDPLRDQRLTPRSSREAFGTSFPPRRRERGMSWVWYALIVVHNVHEYVDVNEDGFGWTLARIWQHRRDGYRVYTKKEDSMGWCLRTTLSDIDAAKVAAMLFC